MKCTATTFEHSNHSGNARGRKIHRSKDGKKTICNMKVDEVLTDEFIKSSVFQTKDRRCKICYNDIVKKANALLNAIASKSLSK